MIKKLGLKKDVDKIKRQLAKKPKKNKKINPDILVPTGSTLLNLSLSDNPFGGYQMGKIVNAIGDSSSGKTFLIVTALATICSDKRFDNFEIFYDDAERAFEFDIVKLFGAKTKKRVKFDIRSNTVQDWLVNIWSLLSMDKPFIYVLDSLDALTSDEEIDKIEQQAKAEEKRRAGKKGKKVKGSYGGQKPKTVSKLLSACVHHIEKTNSIIIIISQTRDNIGFGSQFSPKVRTGGKALKFYCTHEFWMARIKKLTDDTYKRKIGNKVGINVTKNKLTGKERDNTKFNLYYDYGIDDINSCIDFLVSEGYWKKKGKILVAPEFDFNGEQKKLVEIIEDKNFEKDLSQLTGDVWLNIEEAIRLTSRKQKFK